MRENIEGCRKT